MNKDEKDLELDHEYDGIKELNHPLPGWWLATFYGGILFSIAYFGYYTLGSGPSLKDEYKKELSHHQKIKEAYLEKLSEFNQEKFETFYGSPEMISYGKEVYEKNCLSCHMANGSGQIGPNLSDKFWLYAEGTPETIYPFVISGNPGAGMPAWGTYLEEDDLYAVVAYVISFQGFKHDESVKVKEAQGEPFPIYGKEEAQNE